MSRETYIIILGALIAISFCLLMMWEKDIALIFFGILSGFFTSILNVKDGKTINTWTDVVDDEIDIITKDYK